jgi:hypothetical protein
MLAGGLRPVHVEHLLDEHLPAVGLHSPVPVHQALGDLPGRQHRAQPEPPEHLPQALVPGVLGVRRKLIHSWSPLSGVRRPQTVTARP